jgi:hypothetical protein
MGSGVLSRETDRELFSLVPAVKRNRSIPQSTVIPVLIYPDVRAAVEASEAESF